MREKATSMKAVKGKKALWCSKLHSLFAVFIMLMFVCLLQLFFLKCCHTWGNDAYTLSWNKHYDFQQNYYRSNLNFYFTVGIIKLFKRYQFLLWSNLFQTGIFHFKTHKHSKISLCKKLSAQSKLWLRNPDGKIFSLNSFKVLVLYHGKWSCFEELPLLVFD